MARFMIADNGYDSWTMLNVSIPRSPRTRKISIMRIAGI